MFFQENLQKYFDTWMMVQVGSQIYIKRFFFSFHFLIDKFGKIGKWTMARYITTQNWKEKKHIEVNVNFFTNHLKLSIHSSNFNINLKWIETNQEINYEIFSHFKIDFKLYIPII